MLTSFAYYGLILRSVVDTLQERLSINKILNSRSISNLSTTPNYTQVRSPSISKSGNAIFCVHGLLIGLI